jgi:ABC-type transport system involved in cytochrome bd biosynthesis fused ATPase/permease subunit
MVLPVVLILPVKVAALLLFAHGQMLQGVALLIAAKLFATLLISRMFAVTRPQLLTFAWFAALYSTITRWLRWAHERIRATAVYRQAGKLKQAVRTKLAEWLGGVR